MYASPWTPLSIHEFAEPLLWDRKIENHATWLALWVRPGGLTNVPMGTANWSLWDAFGDPLKAILKCILFTVLFEGLEVYVQVTMRQPGGSKVQGHSPGGIWCGVSASCGTAGHRDLATPCKMDQTPTSKGAYCLDNHLQKLPRFGQTSPRNIQLYF